MEFDKPLAYRMRPKNLDEYVGQEHILGKDKIFSLFQSFANKICYIFASGN